MRSAVGALLVFITAPFCFADVEFISPAAGASLDPSDLSISWKDSGDAPALSSLYSYEIDLMAGGDTEADSGLIMVLVPMGTIFGSDSAQAVVPTTMGGKDKNAYYLRFTSTAANGGTVINYSPRFSLKGMNGAWSAAVEEGISTITGTDGPPRVNKVTGSGSDTGGDGTFDVPYGEQTGPTRYAPMMGHPPKTITKKNTKPLYPTSSIKIATSPLGLQDAAQVTVTKSQTFWPQQSVNHAKPASHPNEDMRKFLNRWKD